MEAAIYRGTLRHRRFEPVRHEFTYSLFMVFLDVDELSALVRIAPWLSLNRPNIAGFYESDHFGDLRKSFRERIQDDAKANGISLPDGKIFLLTHLRYFGYAFNPISLFYCYDRAGSLQVVLAEVNNTFGGTRNYWIPNPAKFRCAKELHVSPFNGMDMDYEFVLTEPGESLVAHMNVAREAGSGHFFDATLKLDREPWSAKALGLAMLRFPWMTAKVIAAIHWEALRLYWKKAPVYKHP
jgi:DUF1365 family protein